MNIYYEIVYLTTVLKIRTIVNIEHSCSIEQEIMVALEYSRLTRSIDQKCVDFIQCVLCNWKFDARNEFTTLADNNKTAMAIHRKSHK